jgi:hypothetical protein
VRVADILEQPTPPRLYHYTTQAGLLGIVRDKKIWASHTQYLNDAREFHHAISLVEEQLAEMNRPGSYEDRERGLLDEMKQELKGIEGINVCVCSFSEDGDVLSQWRAYGDRASGFALGFSGAFLRSVSKGLGFYLVKVEYDESRQRRLVRTLIEDVLEENIRQLERSENGDDLDLARRRPAGNLVTYLNRYAPILKHYSFSDEKEWRIISSPLFSPREGFGYRAGVSMLIPYFQIPLSATDQPFQLEEVVVGPTPHPEQSKSAVIGLLAQDDYLEINVRNSAAPYRSW